MRTRKTQDEITTLKAALLTLIEPERPMTVRQVYYRAVSAGFIPKTEQAYKSLGRYLCEMRRAGQLPYSWIADNTRWMRKPTTYNSMQDALMATAKAYRQALWSDARCRVEVWLEKDALAGVLYDVTYQWDVPLMVTRGYPSLTYLQSAAEQIREYPWPTYLYYFGDHDPSGVDIPRKIESELRELSGKAPHFERVAVNPDQISRYNLQTRPATSVN